eukprot:gene11287-21479_t
MLSVTEDASRPSSDKHTGVQNVNSLTEEQDGVEASAADNAIDGENRIPQSEMDDKELYYDTDFQSRRDLVPIREFLDDALLSNFSDKYRKKLGKLLDIERPSGMGKNYLELAARLFPDENFESLRYYLRKSKNPTAFILLKYQKESKGQAKLFDLVEALYLMKRLDAIEIVLTAYSGTKDAKKKENGERTSSLLTLLKRKLFNYDDTVSLCSVQTVLSTSSGGTLSSYHSSESISSVAIYNDIQFPLMNRPPGQYSKENSITIICSPQYMEIVSDGCTDKDMDEHDAIVKNAHTFMSQEIFKAGGYSPKYIPVLQHGTQMTCIPRPLTSSMACVFGAKDKESRQELLRRLSKKEKYQLVPVGPKPIIKTKIITGDIFDLRK